MKFKRLIASKLYCISLNWEWLDEDDKEIKELYDFCKNNGVKCEYCHYTNGDAVTYLYSTNLDSFLKVVKELKGMGLSPYEMGVDYEDAKDWKDIAEKQQTASENLDAEPEIDS